MYAKPRGFWDVSPPFSHLHAERERGVQIRSKRETGNWHSALVANACWGNCILLAGRCLATNTPVNIHNNRKAIASRHSSRWNISLVCPRASQTGLGGKAERWTDCYQHREQLLSPAHPGKSWLLWLNVARHLVGSTGTVCWVPQRDILNFAHELPK